MSAVANSCCRKLCQEELFISSALADHDLEWQRASGQRVRRRHCANDAINQRGEIQLGARLGGTCTALEWPLVCFSTPDGDLLPDEDCQMWSVRAVSGHDTSTDRRNP